ncbi:hypothetical protein SEA_LYMARA_56 [Arthrobacter phage Lymara]|uniref:Uncharacterized protein n=1 Tax=Arthrobacter phage Lymara TaxID=2599828 RepID=A0A5J6TY89_9CAUD|nr:hypothetical protein HYQ01_gp056 [Arthrobacter phage Lymara]QFG14857.1 hypothetical protein SEA_LYMARA_56 [Arthrobacter phage Lymara]
MRIQRVKDGDLVPVEGLDVPAATQVHMYGATGAFMVEEDPNTGILRITRLWGSITLQSR